MYRLLRPLLFRMEAERAHRLGVRAARAAQALDPGLVRRLFRFEHEALRQRVWGIDFPNPVGLAAGFDKNAELLPFWPLLGFGFAEAGSVSARPSAGNPRPRAFRLPDEGALVNRMGLNNEGAERVAARLERAAGRRAVPLGINLAKTHDPAILGEAAVEDFCAGFRRLAPLADYVVLNVSCPNTAEGKTFEEPESLDRLLAAVGRERAALGRAVPVLVKLSPPPGREIAPGGVLDDVIAVARARDVSGFVAANTAPDREGLRVPAERLERIGRGGLSGRPLEARATALVRYLYAHTGGTLPIIGVGGVDGAEAAYRKIRAGASLVELYTALVYEGPGVVRRIKHGLVRLLERDGLSTLGEAVGRDV